MMTLMTVPLLLGLQLSDSPSLPHRPFPYPHYACLLCLYSCHPQSLRMYSSLGFTFVTDTAAAQSVPYVVVDASDAIKLCVRALASFSGVTSTITSVCRCLFACTHSPNNAQYAVLCGAMLPLKLIVRDGSLGTGTVAAAAAALSHIIGCSGTSVDRDPMWQDASLLEKLLFVVAGTCSAAFIMCQPASTKQLDSSREPAAAF